MWQGTINIICTADMIFVPAIYWFAIAIYISQTYWGDLHTKYLSPCIVWNINSKIVIWWYDTQQQRKKGMLTTYTKCNLELEFPRLRSWKSSMLSLNEWSREFQNNALWDTKLFTNLLLEQPEHCSSWEVHNLHHIHHGGALNLEQRWNKLFVHLLWPANRNDYY